ncbi:MAG: hypothetical protein E7448_06970 [Ruminococcaceae bacterium]|nr:hypothetical protein [Oscillospiraceae bacterium]
MRKDPMPLGLAVGVLIVGMLLGSIFTFGMQFWNEKVTRESCTLIETQFVSYKEIRQPKRPMEIKEIAIDCSNGERYFIDGVSINTDLRNALSALSEFEEIVLLLHPNSNTIVEFSNENDYILIFDDTISKLRNEATGFLLLGIFMYFCSLVGLHYTVLNIVRKRKAKMRH